MNTNTRGGVMMPNEKLANGIKGAVGVHSVYLAAKHDENLAGRFSHTDGKALVDGELKATRRSIANVMVYMAGKYGQQLTLEEVEMGLLAASPSAGSTTKRQKPGPNFDGVGKEYAERLSKVLTPNEVGAELKDIINNFNLYDATTSSYRTLEQGLGVAMRIMGWERRRQMTGGTRAYRWYPPEGFFDEAQVEPIEPEDIALGANNIEEVFDDDWADEIADEEPVEVAPVQKKKRSGVKPDEALAERIRTMNLFAGISSYEVALNSYDFVGNNLEIPKTDEDMTHKVKLSIGATMKAMDWKKRTRRVEGIPTVGWHPPVGWEGEVAVERVVRRKPVAVAEPVAEEPKPRLADQLPRLKEDSPWPDESEFSGDEGEQVEDEFESKVFVKMLNLDDGTEDVVERVILMKNAGTYLLGTEDEPRERMLEWDGEEEIWVCTVGSAEE
tara:strand:- start:232 stop:1560 length:1329 start_codon:yes stop_codon:yes gene_type:complete